MWIPQNKGASMAEKAIIYARVSTAKQAERGYSLPTQEAACRRFAEERGINVIAVVSDDESGKSLNRDNLPRLREMFQAGQADALVIYELGRLSRDELDYRIFIRDLQRQGIAVYNVVRGRRVGETPEDDLIDMIEAWSKRKERLDIIERTTRGKRGAAEAGKYISGGITPYGYRRETILGPDGKEGSVLAEVPEEAEIIRCIFTWFVSGDGERGPMGVRQIMERLNERSVMAPGLARGRIRLRPDTVWVQSTIYNILKNPAYIGTFHAFRFRVHDDGSRSTRPQNEWVTIPTPVIVDRELWDKVQEKLRHGRERSLRNTKRPYLLRSHITCQCGYKWVGMASKSGPKHGRKEYVYYVCTGIFGINTRTCCLPYVRAATLEHNVWEWVQTNLFDEENLAQHLARLRTEGEVERVEATKRLRDLEAELLAVEKKLNMLLDLYLTESLSKAEYLAKKRQLEEHKEHIDMAMERAIEQATSVITPELAQSVQELAREYRVRAEHATFEDKRALLDAIQLEVTIQQREDGMWAAIQSAIGTAHLRVSSTPS